MRTKTSIIYLFIMLMCFTLPLQAKQNKKRIQKTVYFPKSLAERVDSVLALMTIDEKIGQLNQYSSNWATGPLSPDTAKLDDIKNGKVGSMLNVKGYEKTLALQEIAMQSRLKIPLLFGLDVIHGYKTTFPIPLAESCSWDLGARNKQRALQQLRLRQQVFTRLLRQWWT